ncbi:type II secretion system protein N [Sessilibacter corallicola]|uniref:type II secretion system protein N n=1 Tax=Sessilibacter corallicola TaxID=2904075 RepID=UPI001E4C8D65|nr:type II secretion system protein N [Sessilibacter corallicola]MCE2027974.1 type II secretion system protein N [Sessilibacter corallicola]
MSQYNILTKKRLWAILLILLLVLLVMRTPAQWAAYGFTQAVPGLRMAEISGSLWDGRSGSTQISIDSELYSLGEFHWEISPLSLVTFSPCADVDFSFQKQNASGYACGSGNVISLSDFELNLPAELASLFAPTQLAGDFSLVVIEGEFAGNQVEKLNGNLAWRDGAFHDGEKWIKVGSFGALLSEDGQKGINIDLEDLGGPVIADLDANFNRIVRPNDDVGVEFKGEVGVRESAHPDLQTILPTMAGAIGEPSERGFTVEWSL